MQIIIDLDGTICTEEKTYSRSLAKPLPNAVGYINQLHDEGNIIIIYSARSWMEFEMTSDWLKKNEIKYHQLVLGKPIGDIWIDDRAIAHKDWDETIKQIKNKKK